MGEQRDGHEVVVVALAWVDVEVDGAVEAGAEAGEAELLPDLAGGAGVDLWLWSRPLRASRPPEVAAGRPPVPGAG